MGSKARPILHIDLDAVMTAFPLRDIEAILSEFEANERRVRKLPAVLTVWLVIALGLMVSTGAKEVLRRLLDQVREPEWWPPEGPVASEAAITKARRRIGAAPIRSLFERVAQPKAKRATRGAFFRKRRLVTLDGSTLHVQDSAANERQFGRPGSAKTAAAWPQIRFVVMIENGTHLPFAAAMSGWRTSENALARSILVRLEAGMLCLADRLFYSYDMWAQAVATGADLLWRVQKQISLPRLKTFSDRSYLSEVRPPVSGPKHKLAPPIPVRVVEFTAKVRHKIEHYRVITTLTNPRSASALELARLYANRWTIEIFLRELKTYLRGRRTLLRSKVPELVEQDFYGLLLAYYGVRSEMHDAALQEQIAPGEISFVHALNTITRRLPEAISFSPSGHDGLA